MRNLKYWDSKIICDPEVLNRTSPLLALVIAKAKGDSVREKVRSLSVESPPGLGQTDSGTW